MFQIQEELKKLPRNPGVYIMHDSQDSILYVGKAINLRNRVRSYFRANIGRGPQIDKMVTLIDHFEYIVTDSELEALVLENNLIKEHRPPYNTLLKDDKTYPYIKVTLGEEYPRVLFSRSMKKDRSRYFGPFTGAAAVKETIDLVNRLFMLRTCNRKFPRDIGQGRPCLNYHINQCNAPCKGDVPLEEYMENIKKALDFLGGNQKEVLNDLRAKMEKASDDMDFEEAIRCRELIKAVESVSEKQKITDSDGEDKDILALARDENDALMQVFFVRGGKLIGRDHFYMTQLSEEGSGPIISSFIKQFYAGTPFIPKELMLQEDIDDKELIEEYLSKRKGSKVHIRIPKLGQKEKLVELAAQNAEMTLSRDRERIKREAGRTIGAAAEIAELLGMGRIDRMEAFDISNISGFQNVGSMVVYEKGKAKRSDYRKFRIKTVSGPDDYACMKEVLTRRFSHGLDEMKQKAEAGEDGSLGSFTRFPDLLLMDGGKGQVNIALEVLNELSLNIPVCGMVKDDHHRTRGLYYNNTEIPIDRHSEGFKLITRIQDEAHRFAIEYHRSLRGKSQVKSVLDDIPGVGPARRKALMKHFASIEDIKNADEEQLKAIPEITADAAKKIYNYFH